jgi:CRP/FNR family transcriptional regulator, cyclic AMP receptor protein
VKNHLTERQTKVMVALYRERAFRRAMGRSVSSLVERRCLLDSRYAGPLAGLEEAGLVESHRDRVRPGHRSSSLWWLTSNGRGAAEDLSGRSGEAGYGRATVRLLEVDRALAATLDEPSRVDAEARAVVDVLAVAPGEWTSQIHSPEWRRGLGLLVLEGLLAGEVTAGSRTFLELLGPGDLVRPWTHRPEFSTSLATPAKWDVLTSARFAVLDREATLRLAAWPEITGVLLDRTVERSRSLAVQFALRQEGRIEERVRFALWHLARRWGELDGKRVVLSLGPLSPLVISRMAATTPASAALAMQSLQERGLVESLASGGLRLSPASRP